MQRNKWTHKKEKRKKKSNTVCWKFQSQRYSVYVLSTKCGGYNPKGFIVYSFYKLKKNNHNKNNKNYHQRNFYLYNLHNFNFLLNTKKNYLKLYFLKKNSKICKFKFTNRVLWQIIKSY